ncbi:hypothetical protein N9014_00135 [bacterium]|nr:hypothetical protein [bacterium]
MAQSEKIIISVELRDKGVTTGSNKAKKAVDGLTESAKRLAKAEKELAFQESKEGKELAALTIKKQLAAKANRELALATMKTTKATMQGKTQSGLNNAILTEAGRTASDAAYGMQGMANNLGQLLTLMSQHVQTKGGFVASMKSLMGSLFGIGGILIGLQLLISYLPQIQKYFEGLGKSVFKVSEALEGAGTDASKTIGDFDIFIETIQSSSKSLEEKKDAIDALNKQYPEFVSNLDEAGVSMEDIANQTKEAATQTALYTEEIERQAIAEAARSVIQKARGELMEQELQAEMTATELGFKNVQEMRKAAEQTKKEIEEGISQGKDISKLPIFGIVGAFLARKIPDELYADAIASIREFFGDQTAEALVQIEKLDDAAEYAKLAKENLMKFIDIPPGGDGALGAGRGEKIFKEKLLEYIAEIKNARKIAQTEDAVGAQALLDAKQTLRREELLNELNLFKAKEKLRLDEFKARKGVTKKQIDNAQATYNKEIELAGKSYNEVLVFVGLAEKAEQASLDTEETMKENAHTKDMARLQRRIDTTKALVDSEGDEIKGLILPNTREQLEEDAVNIEKEMAQKDLLLSGVIEDYDVRRKLEIDRTNLELELAKKRMTIAQIEEDAKRANIKNIIGLLGSASKVAKKGSVASKALAIASTTVSTWTTAQAASETQMKAGGTTAPIRAAIAYAAAIAKGALTVKNIVAEKKPGGGSSGGGGGMPPVQPADFNIIGSTGTNQLADAIGGTTQQPIKAYVVSGEVTSAQELDRNIVESASI